MRLLLLLLLTACAVLPLNQAPLNEKITVDSRQQQLSALKQWSLSGKIGVIAEDKGWSANMTWTQQAANHYDITLSGPLNSGAIKLSARDNQVTLTTTDNKTYRANNATALLVRETGWQLPFDNLYYWIRGIPAPGGKAAQRFDPYNHLVELRQQGWVIRYLRFAGVNKQDLPSKIVLSREKLTIKLVIRWETRD